MTNSPAYGPVGYGNNKMKRWMRLFLEGAKKNVMLSPSSHRPRTLSLKTRFRTRTRRVKARTPNNK